MPTLATSCCICSKSIKWMEPGTCHHESGLAHHLACPLTPAMEAELVEEPKYHPFFDAEEPCLHEPEDRVYTSNPPMSRCKKCKEFYRADTQD